MSKRAVNMDLLRILASFMVVMLHVSAKRWHSVDVSSIDWKVFNLYDSAVRSSVPLFFMISGALFLSRDKMMSLSNLVKRSIFKLFIIYIVWTVLYAVDSISLPVLLAPGGIRQLFSSALNPHYHLWYLPSLICVYLLYPLLFCLVKHEDGKYLKYACTLFVIFGVIIPTIGIFTVDTIAAPITANLKKFTYELTGYSGYFMWGYFLSKKDWSKTPNYMLLLALLAIIGISAVIGDMDATSKGAPAGILYSYMCLPVFCEASLIFAIFSKMKLNLGERTSKAIVHVSKCTLIIYLLHPFVLGHLSGWFGIDTMSFASWASVPVISFGIFAVCLLTATILRKMMAVSKSAALGMLKHVR